MEVLERNLSICVMIFLMLFSIKCKNDSFKYSGTLPEWEYLNIYNAEEIGELRPVDQKMVSVRNRIYITVDHTLQVTLNGSPVNDETFADGFRYIYTNPDGLRHLPENPKKAVVFYAMDIPANLLSGYATTMEQQKRLLELNELENSLEKIVLQLRERYFQVEYEMPLFRATDELLEELEELFPLNLAVYSNGLFKNDNRGISAKLPPWSEKSSILKERNIISVFVNHESKLFLRDEPFKIKNLTDRVKSMILNRFEDPTYPEDPKKAIVSLKNDRATDYEFYLEVYTKLKRAYDELWEEEAELLYGKPYANLNSQQINTIRKKIPFILSESEPTAFRKK
jgi:Biopolymer transport protein ExbD/TolR.